MSHQNWPAQIMLPQLKFGLPYLPYIDLAFRKFGTKFFLAQNASDVQLLLECKTKAMPCLFAGFIWAPV